VAENPLNGTDPDGLGPAVGWGPDGPIIFHGDEPAPGKSVALEFQHWFAENARDGTFAEGLAKGNEQNQQEFDNDLAAAQDSTPDIGDEGYDDFAVGVYNSFAYLDASYETWEELDSTPQGKQLTDSIEVVWSLLGEAFGRSSSTLDRSEVGCGPPVSVI
jgi:hypothetical protein